jgi:hypothetical protein
VFGPNRALIWPCCCFTGSQTLGTNTVTDESLIREVDEEVRQEEYKKLWDRYGTAFTALAVLIVLSVGGFEAWKYWQRQQSEQASVVYLDATRKAAEGKFDDALAALAAVKQDGFGQLAKLSAAAVLAEKGETAKAVEAYKAFAAASGSDPALADLATIRAGYLQVDTATPDELLASLGKYDRDDNVWRHAAREVFGLSAYRVKDYAMADRYMNALFADPETPEAMRQRAQVMIQLITPELPTK